MADTGSQPTPAPAKRHLFDANWERPSAEAMLLYVAEEPRIGYEFSYFGLRWEIVDYREGWVARLLV